MDAEVLQHVPQQIQGQAHHVEVVPLDPGDEQRRLSLGPVGPRLVHGLSGADVAPDLVLLQGPEGDGGGLRPGLDPPAPAQGHAGPDVVGPSREDG